MTPSYFPRLGAPVSTGIPVAVPAARPGRPQPNLLERLAFLLLCTFLFLMFGRPADFLFPYLHAPLVISVSALLTAVLTGGVLLVLRSPIGILMTLLTGWFIVTVPFSTHRGGSMELLSEGWMRSYLCFVLVLAICSRPLYVRRVIHTLAWSVLVASLLAMAYGIAPHGRIQLPFGLLSGPNELAGAMVIGMLYWMFILFDPGAGKLYRVFSIAASLPIMLILIKTGSRGGLLTLAVAFAIMFLRFSLGRKIGVALGSIVLVIMAFVVLPDDLRRRYTTYFQSDLQSPEAVDIDDPTGSTESRLYLLERSIQFTLEHPIVGVGLSQYAPQEDVAARKEGKRKGSWLGTHNTYTQISSETGIPGLAIFLAILIMAVRNISWILRTAGSLPGVYGQTLVNAGQALQTVLVAYLVMFLFEHTAYLPLWPTLVGMIAALRSSLELELPYRQAATPAAIPARPGQPAKAAVRRPDFQPVG